ncbi:hypothetical protein I5M27_06925 [Adhaeribacter sp. BT258]|uniref:Outer membrane protein beta-barrel domain-containing protein n=1 Tax=Adhaeribacter terrigena TaxID=2793070 RepID=A0ABS1C0L8_9BACT|nr:hypothetical protein [Adhaeribacter terrigena]MBK0402712.1 hypothetical protein [Adhaeribacter terrigena]
MRVDKDWEEGIGKKLYDFEGELSEQAWSNINQRIKPRRDKRYFWLPALLFFMTLPTALYFTDPLSWLKSENQNLSQTSPETTVVNLENGTSKTVPVQGEKPELDTYQATNETAENGMVSGIKTHEANNNAAVQSSEATAKNPLINSGNKPANNISGPGLIAATKPSGNITVMEENERSESENKAQQATERQNISARSGIQQAGALAINKPEASNANKGNRTNNASEIRNAKTVGFSTEKPGTGLAKAMLTNNPEVKNAGLQNAENGNLVQSETSREIAWLKARVPSLAGGFTAAEFPETLPDSLKKQLITALPEPENQIAGKDKNQEKPSTRKWAFAIYSAPQYTFQRVLPNQQDGISILQLENKNEFEKERLGFEFGFRAYYPVRKNLQLILGFQAARMNQYLRLHTVNTAPDSVVIKQQSNSVSMQVYNTQRQEEHLFRYYFGGIFTGMKLTLSEKLDLSGGLGLNWLLQNKTTNEKTKTPAAAFNPYLNLGLEYKQPLSQKLTLTAGPAMQYYLKPAQEKQAFIGVKPTTLGFSVGLQYKP